MKTNSFKLIISYLDGQKEYTEIHQDMRSVLISLKGYEDNTNRKLEIIPIQTA